MRGGGRGRARGVRGAGVVGAEREAAAAEAEGERDETRDTYSHLLVRASTRACLLACHVSSRDIRVPLFECARGLYRPTTDKDFRLLESVVRKFPRGGRDRVRRRVDEITSSCLLLARARSAYISSRSSSFIYRAMNRECWNVRIT